MTDLNTLQNWFFKWMEKNGVPLWGVADLEGFQTPKDETGKHFPRAVSFAIPMNPQIMKSIQKGPNQKYADEYTRVNNLINDYSEILAKDIMGKGFQAKALPASVRSDTINIKGDFPQKTAATRAGLGWVGLHCQLVTKKFGSWVRLGTVFTNMDLPAGTPVEKNLCGKCRKCVDACPAKALEGNKWYPGIAREEILDVNICDKWKKENYYRFHKGHNCGICSAVCPHGLKSLQRGHSSGAL